MLASQSRWSPTKLTTPNLLGFPKVDLFHEFLKNYLANTQYLSLGHMSLGITSQC